MSRRPVSLLIEDIWEGIEKVERYTKDMTLEVFVRDEKTADAVVRNLEIIGEAANRLPDDFRLNIRRSNGARLWVCATGSFTGISEST